MAKSKQKVPEKKMEETNEIGVGGDDGVYTLSGFVYKSGDDNNAKCFHINHAQKIYPTPVGNGNVSLIAFMRPHMLHILELSQNI